MGVILLTVWAFALAGCADGTPKSAERGAGAGAAAVAIPSSAGGSGSSGSSGSNPSGNPVTNPGSPSGTKAGGSDAGVPVGPFTPPSPSPPSAFAGPLPNRVKTFPLMSCPAPAGNGGGAGLAWVELQARAPDGEDPSQEMLIDLYARLGGVQVSVPQMAVSLAEEEFITWLSPTKVLLLGSYLADFEGQGQGSGLGPDSGTGAVKALDVPPWGARVSPDGLKVAYWGYTDPTDGAKGPAVYDLRTGKTRALKLFRYEDWGLPTFDMGIAPLVTWLDDKTVLFDGPYQQLPAIYRGDLTTGKVGVWREKAWSVRASGDGRYVSFNHREAWLVPRPGTAYAVTVVDVAGGGSTDLRATAPTLGAALLWDRGTAGRFALVDGSRVAAGIMRGSQASLVAETKAAGTVVGLRFTAAGISFFDLEREGFTPTAVTAKVLLRPAAP